MRRRRRPHVAGAPCLPVVVDLDRPLGDLVTGGARQLHVCARLSGRPVGTCFVPAPLDPMPGGLLAEVIGRELAEPLRRAALWTTGAVSPGTPAPTATVVVCTRDRPEGLARCLQSLRLLANPLPVLVVDNGSTVPGTREAAEAAGATYVWEPLPGLDRARNRGIADVRSDVVLFTDDDVEVDVGWADALLTCFADPLVMAATGLVLPARLDTPTRLRQERYLGFSHRGVVRRVVDGTAEPATIAGQWGAGASMAFRTGFLREVGGFPEELDAGMPTRSGGDTYALYRALRDGFRVVYEPAAVVFHHHRDSDDELVRAARGYFSGAAAYLWHAAVVDRDPDTARAQFWLMRTAVTDTARAVLGRGTPLDLALAQTRGALEGLPTYWRARRIVRRRDRVVVPDGTSQPATPPSDDHARGASRAIGAAPTISVVIPTRGRREKLLRLLRSLDAQEYAASVEIIVSLDGDVDGSAAAIEARSGRRPVTVVRAAEPARPGGAGAARNVGAAVATGELLLFLDDDMEPTGPDLLTNHARTHATGDGPGIVVGPVPPRQWHGLDLHGRMVRNWWIDHTRRMETEPALAFTDVSSGNLSVPRHAFIASGGFAPLPRREDWEFGYRMLTEGLWLRGAPGAAVLHEADLDLESALADRRQEGAGDVALAQRHPALVWQLPLGEWPEMSRKWRLPVELLLLEPSALDRIVAGARVALRALDPAAPGRTWHRMFVLATFASYWSGVALATGGERALADLFATAPVDDPAMRPVIELTRPGPWVPPPGATRNVEVRLHGITVGLAPLAWGGVPWSVERFRDAVVAGFADRVSRAGARAVVSS